MDLFEYAKSKTLDQESPLASRLRPTTLDEVVGQQHIIGKNTLLYRAIKADKLTSVIFYGPPGTGKTTPEGQPLSSNSSIKINWLLTIRFTASFYYLVELL